MIDREKLEWLRNVRRKATPIFEAGQKVLDDDWFFIGAMYSFTIPLLDEVERLQEELREKIS